MKLQQQKERVLSKGLLKKPQTATVVAHRVGFEKPQQIASALGALVDDGIAVRRVERGRPTYAKV